MSYLTGDGQDRPAREPKSSNIPAGKLMQLELERGLLLVAHGAQLLGNPACASCYIL
jgi:hypothetical protein